MKKVAVSLLVVCFASTFAFGGMVDLVQTSTDDVYNDSNLGGTTAVFDIYIDSTVFPTGFTALDLDLGSNALTMTDVTLDGAFSDLFNFGSTISAEIPGTGAFASDAFITGFYFGPGIQPRILAGTLTVDATGADAMDHTLGVVGELADANDARDPLSLLQGGGVVSVLPEPATVSLLVLGTLGLIRRRKAS